jgi:hypothetical protein
MQGQLAGGVKPLQQTCHWHSLQPIFLEELHVQQPEMAPSLHDLVAARAVGAVPDDLLQLRCIMRVALRELSPEIRLG